MRLIDADKMTKIIHEHYDGYGINDMITDIKERAFVDVESKPEWVRVDDKLPPMEATKIKCYSGHYLKSIRVLCACRQRSGKVMVKEGYCEWYSDYRVCWRIPGSIDYVTHWMLLPEPPTEKI